MGSYAAVSEHRARQTVALLVSYLFFWFVCSFSITAPCLPVRQNSSVLPEICIKFYGVRTAHKPHRMPILVNIVERLRDHISPCNRNKISELLLQRTQNMIFQDKEHISINVAGLEDCGE